MLALLRVLALAVLVLVIAAQRFAYTTVVDLPTTPGANALDVDYVGVGAPGTDVDAICPTGIEFLDATHVSVIDVDNRRIVELDVGAKRIASASDIGLDRSIIPEGAVADQGVLYTWVQDVTGRLQAAVPLARGANGRFQSFAGLARQLPLQPEVERRLSGVGFPGSTIGGQRQRFQGLMQRARLRGWSESLTSPNGQTFNVNYVMTGNGHVLGIGLEAAGKARSALAKTRHDIVSARALAATDAGDVFVLVTSIDRSVPVIAVHEAVYKLNTGPAAPAVYDIPLEGQDCIARQHVAISPNGGVYALRVTAERVALLKIGKRSFFSWLYMPFSRLGHADPTLGAPFNGWGHLMSAQAYPYVDKPSSGSMSRRDVLHNACLYLNHQWPLEDANLSNGSLCACDGAKTSCKHWMPPPRLQGHAGESVGALPYNWGGADRLEQFDQKLTMNRPAGQVCTPTKGGDVLYDSTHAVNDTYPGGVDCSGFVTRAWGWPGSAHSYTTSTLSQIADPLSDVLDLRPGDVMNFAGSHVRMMLNWRGANSVEIIESSTWGGGVDRRIMTLASLSSYKPMRARHVSNDVSGLTVDDITCVP